MSLPRPGGAIRALLAILVALLVLGQLPSAASGDHGGRSLGSLFACDRPVTPPRCTSVGNNLLHAVAFDATLTEGLASSLRDTLVEDYGRTKLVTLVQDEATPATDVIAFSEDYGDNGAAGWVHCPPDAPQGLNAAGDRWCQRQELYFNLNPRYAAFFADDASRDHIACHEVGHTVGLRHWGNPPETDGPAAATCMNANTPNGPTDLHQADRDHIDEYRFLLAPLWHPRITLIADAGRPADAPADPGLAWTGGVDAAEVERFVTLEELTGAADAVVRGRVVSIAAGRSFGGATGHALHYAAATVQVDELLRGTLPAGHRHHLVLEIPLFAGADSLGELQARVDSTETVFFLRNKATSARQAGLSAEAQAEEVDFYRLVSLASVIENRSGTASVPDDESRALSSVAGASFAAAVERVRAAAQDSD